MRCAIVRGLFGLVSVCLMAGAAARAQDSPPAAGASISPNASAAGAQESSKKVWTNENISDLHDDTSIPAPGSATRKTAPRAMRPPTSGVRNAGWYYNQIAQLQAKVPPLDDQIAALEAAIDGKATGDAKTSTRPYGVGLRIDSWSAQRDKLMKKRDGILAEIDTLRDDARHNGVPDSALP